MDPLLPKRRKLKIAVVADILTETSLRMEAETVSITPMNYLLVLRAWKPDFLFVESVWNGKKDKWKYKVASYSDYPERSNKVLQKVVSLAKSLGIPTVFWNKEDGIHFDRFIESAKFFDYIFTVDENCIPKYRSIVDSNVTVSTLMFAVQPRFHHFSGFHFKYNRANFVGSYSRHIHEKRRLWQDNMFDAASSTGLGLSVYDRNSSRKSAHYRVPVLSNMDVRPAVRYDHTGQIYKDYLVSLNVNTVEDSPTMFSRRLVEIIACGGIAVTNSSPAVEKYFNDYCHVVTDKQEMLELFERLKKGPSSDDLERAEAGAKYVAEEHTWGHRLSEICNVIGVVK